MPCKLIEMAGRVESLVITSSWPDRSVVLAGVKWTLKERTLPEARERGRVPNPSTRKAELERDTCEILTEAAPLFWIEIFWTVELPTVTAPNSRDEGVATRVAASGVPEGDAPIWTTPPQPEIAIDATQVRSRAARATGLDCDFLRKANERLAKICGPKVGRISISNISYFSRAKT